MYVAAFYAFREVKWKNCDYVEQMRMLRESCKPYGLTFECISDEQQAELPTFITELPANLMQAITAGQLAYIEARRDQPILLTGADCLIAKDPRNECPPEYDIAITSPKMTDSINTGGIWINNHEKCAAVWRDTLAARPQGWGDDQRRLWEVLMLHQRKHGLKILRHNTETHNRPSMLDDKDPPFIVHFKGQRKSEVRPWFNKRLGASCVTPSSVP